MEKKKLNLYRKSMIRMGKLKQEIEELERRDLTTIKGVVKTSSKEFPYIMGRSSVLMPEEQERILTRILIKKKEYEKMKEQMTEIEEYIANVSDPLDKSILEMYYMDPDRKNQKEIAAAVGKSRSYIARIIMSYSDECEQK